MKDRKKDPLSRARPVLAVGADTRHQSFTCMIFNTQSAQARRGPDCARRVSRGLSRLRSCSQVRVKDLGSVVTKG